MNNYLKINTINVINQLQEVNETIDILSGGVETLNEDIQRLKSEIFHRRNELQPVTQEFPILNKSIEEQNASIDGIKYNQDVLEQDIPSIKQKINDMRSTSHDGTFIWQISCVQEKIGQQLRYSQKFYIDKRVLEVFSIRAR
jgi:chromosome segregation ATPase